MALNSQTLLEAAEYKPGYCPITKNKIIERGRPLPNYNIIYFELDNGSVMPLAVDKNANPTEADWDMVMQHVRDGWQWEINQKKWTPKQIKEYKDAFFNLRIIRRIE